MIQGNLCEPFITYEEINASATAALSQKAKEIGFQNRNH